MRLLASALLLSAAVLTGCATAPATNAPLLVAPERGNGDLGLVIERESGSVGVLDTAARQRLGTEVTEIRTATSYACRRRNNGSSGKMSEHSKANALDMSGFTFAKQTDVTVGGKGSWGEGLLGAIGLSKSNSFLEDIRQAACAHFTTVLGPGSDPWHGDHFHVDVLARKGGYRICQ